MGLLDGILGSVLGNLGGSSTSGGMGSNNGGAMGSALGRVGGSIAASALMTLAFQLLQQNGGISGIVDKLRNSGLGQHASSWVGTGDNMPVSGDQLRNAFGSDELAQLAKHAGLTPDQASSGLAQVLPELVNQMTPAGHVTEDHNDLISQALSMLSRRGTA